MSTGKEIYEQRKRLAAERKLRDEEAAIMRSNDDEEGALLLAAGVMALEAIADALTKIANNEDQTHDK